MTSIPNQNDCIFPSKVSVNDLSRLDRLAISGYCPHVRMINPTKGVSNSVMAFYVLVDSNCFDNLFNANCSKHTLGAIRLIARRHYTGNNKVTQIAYKLICPNREIEFI